MHIHKHIYVLVGALSLLTVGALQAPLSASVTSDCAGKPYGTPGCPLQTQSNSSVLATCGNAVVDNGEECDYGKNRNGISNCTTSCTLLYCGDQVISPQLGEECEPDTQQYYVVDPTTGQLTTEVHYVEPSCGTICTVPTCDAQGTCTGGCTRKFMAACPVSQGAVVQAASSSSLSLVSLVASSASSTPAPATIENSISRCGDGVVSPSEQCDEGIANSNLPGGRCRIDCTYAKCGDTIVDSARGEQCDDGANNSDLPNGHCRTNCSLPKCGDGFIDTSRGEQCDDGPNNSNAPNAHCRLDCVMQRCGDGVMDVGEECDSGVNNSDLANAHCSKSCTLPKCGDGVLQAGEQCDEGPNNTDLPNAHCRMNCTFPKCGDGVIDTSRGEACDDGFNNSDLPGGHCRISCSLPKCGDGIIQFGEECDDGIKNSATRPNACRLDCRASTCGDMVMDSDEQCDHGKDNGTAGNNCSAQCEMLKAAAPLQVVHTTSPYLPIALPLAFIGALGVLSYIFRKKLHTFISKIAGEKVAASIDDIPLDEIEMPWHKW